PSRISGSAAIGAVIGVSITPAATALTRTPRPAHATARLRVSESRPDFAAPYPGTMVLARNAVIEVMPTTLAPPSDELAARRSPRPTVRRIAPTRFTWIASR